MPKSNGSKKVQSRKSTKRVGPAKDVLSAAGVYYVQAGQSGIDDSENFLSRWFGPDELASPKDMLRQLDQETRGSLVKAMLDARLGKSATCELSPPLTDEDLQRFRVHVAFNPHAIRDRWSFVIVDVSSEHQSIQSHKTEEEHLRHIVEYNPQLPWVADGNGQIVDFTDRWLNSTGMSREEATGEGWLKKTHPDDIEGVATTIRSCHETGIPFDITIRLEVEGTYRWMRARGFPRRDESGNVVNWYGYTEDVHEKVLIDNQILWDAEHDSLTGLHNRSYFSTKLASAIREAPAKLNKVALLLVDLDNFKHVNDLMGHVAGDNLIRRFARALNDTAPENAVVARLGGDEFALMLSDVNAPTEAAKIAEKILAIQGNFDFAGRSVNYHASIGIGHFPEHGINANQLLRHTDLALYRAKSNGRAQIQVFEKKLLDDMQERVAMVNRARTAAKEGRILAYYQPKVCLETRQLAGFEALLRWQDSQGRIQAPASIYAAFDEKTVAELLGQTMMSHIFKDISFWKELGLKFHQVAINASPVEMRQSDFVDRVKSELQAYDIGNSEIEVEITEGVFIGTDADASRRSIDQLAKAGIPLALDDFGTGYASLSHLRDLPISTIKVDRSFVQDVGENNSDFAIVSAIIAMGQASGMKVVAEGIEQEAQELLLKKLGCDVGQGFLFGRPVPSHEVPWLIENWQAFLDGQKIPHSRDIKRPLKHAVGSN